MTRLSIIHWYSNCLVPGALLTLLLLLAPCPRDAFLAAAPLSPLTRGAVATTATTLHNVGGGSNLNSAESTSPTNDDDDITRKVVFGTAFIGENIYSYTSPGADGTIFPQSDLNLIQQLLDPNVMSNAPPMGYALFSLLFFNSFIYLPLVWGSILHPITHNPKSKSTPLPAWPFVVASTAFGGIGLYPYLAFRQQYSVVSSKTTATPPPTTTTTTTIKSSIKSESLANNFFEIFDTIIGKLVLVAIVSFTFYTYSTSQTNLSEDIDGLWNMFQTSQFVSTSIVDTFIGSILFLDPIVDDAKRRGYIINNIDDDNKNSNSFLSNITITKKLWPFAMPVFGPLLWVLVRPSPRKDEK